MEEEKKTPEEYEKDRLEGEWCCPECGCPDEINILTTIDDLHGYDLLRQSFECCNCNLKWTENYKLISIEKDN